MSPIKLSAIARALLTAAVETTDGAVTLPDRLPVAARRAVVQSMLTAGVVEEFAVGDDQPAWRTAESGERLCPRATRAGLDVVRSSYADDGPSAGPRVEGHTGVLTAGPTSDGVTAKSAPHSPSLQLSAAAEAVLLAWDNDAIESHSGLSDVLDVLRAALATAWPVIAMAGTPRTGTKREAVLTLLRRSEGATVAEVVEATRWAQHTVRGFFAALKKREIGVDVLERVRQVGSGKQGAKGSYTVYRAVEAA